QREPQRPERSLRRLRLPEPRPSRRPAATNPDLDPSQKPRPAGLPHLVTVADSRFVANPGRPSARDPGATGFCAGLRPLGRVRAVPPWRQMLHLDGAPGFVPDSGRLVGVSGMEPRQLDFQVASCGKICGRLSESPRKIFEFFSCQLLIGFDRQYKPLFFNYKYVTRPVEKPGTPSEPNHLEFRRVSTIRCEREVTKGLFAFPRGLLFLLIFAHAQHRQKR